MLKKFAALIAVETLMLVSTVNHAQPDAAYALCPEISDAVARLECFDSYVVVEEPAAPRRGRYRGEPYVRQLRSDGPNFLGFTGPVGDSDLDRNQHVEFNVSVRYPLWERQESLTESSSQRTGFLLGVDRTYLIYHGKYDFHMLRDDYGNGNRYESAPVISKDQNPGVALEWDLDQDRLRKLRVAMFHHSNGQSLSTENLQQFNDELAKGGLGFALDQVSRTSNYLQLRYQRVANSEETITTNWNQFQLELRPIYFGVDDSVFWEQGLTEQPKIQDYDGLRLMNEKFYSLNPLSSFLESTALITRLELRTGIRDNRALSNLSSQWTVGLMWRKLMMTAFYFDGYGKEISTYHLRSRLWGLGLEIR